MLLQCTGWVEKLGGREKVEQRANSFWWHSGIAPTVFVDVDCLDDNKLRI